MKKNDLKLLIFDMDGVLLDSEPLHENARQIMFRRLGIKPDNNIPNPVGKSSSEFWETICQAYSLEGDGEALEHEQYSLVAKQIVDNDVKPSQGLVEVLKKAKSAGLKIGVASSSTRYLVDEALGLLNIEHYFDITVSGSDVIDKKPAPDIYLQLLERMNTPAVYAIAVEDSGAGITAAKAAGIYCYGYNNITSPGQNLSNCDKIITSLSELLNEF